jgi:hypothetical protein
LMMIVVTGPCVSIRILPLINGSVFGMMKNRLAATGCPPAQRHCK